MASMKKELASLQAASPEAATAGELVQQQAMLERELQAIMLPGEQYDLDLFASRIHACENQAQFALLETGRLFRIMQLKEGSTFRAACERIGRTASYGYRMSALFKKMGSGERAKLLQLGSSRAMEFLAFDAEDLDAIAGNEVDGLTLDDVSKMTVCKLRAEVRKARTKLADGKETLDMMMQKNSERMRELEKAADLGPKYSELPKELLADVARECAAVCAAVATIKARVQQFVQMVDVEEHDVPDETRHMLQAMVKNAEKSASELIGLVG